MTHTEYTELFRDLAARHLDIQHTDKQSHFARIILTADPMMPMAHQIDEFVNGLGYKLLSPVVLLAAFERDFRDELSDNVQAMLSGRLIILADMPQRNYQEEENIYQRTEELGLDLLSEVYRELSDDPRRGLLDWNQVSSEKLRISSKRNLAGTAYNFSIMQTYVNINRVSRFVPKDQQ